MAKYTATKHNSHSSHNFLLALPLAIITVVSLGFVFMQPTSLGDKASSKELREQRNKDTDMLKDSSAVKALPRLEESDVANDQSTSNGTSPNSQPAPAAKPQSAPTSSKSSPSTKTSPAVDNTEVNLKVPNVPSVKLP